MNEPHSIFTIYDHPSDFPGSFVVREWVWLGARYWARADPAAVTATLAEARAVIPAGYIRVPRSRGDDRTVVESWL